MMPPYSAAASAVTPQSALTSPALASTAPYNPYLGQAVQHGGMPQFYDAAAGGAANYVTSQALAPAGSIPHFALFSDALGSPRAGRMVRDVTAAVIVVQLLLCCRN